MITGSEIAVIDEEELRVPCEVYSRIVGYLRPVQAWNKGKQQEFTDREVFKVPAALERKPLLDLVFVVDG